MEQGKIVYQNNGFQILEYPRIRNYNIDEINRKDRVYRIRLIGDDQPTIEDCAKLVYYLLKNNVIENKFYEYKDMILDAIYKAENERSYPENLEEP